MSKDFRREIEFTPLGDSALTLRLHNAEGLPPDVVAMLQCLEAAAIPGVVEFTPSYTTIAVFYDPAVVQRAGAPADGIIEWLESRITDAIAAAPSETIQTGKSSVEIPVCYDPEFALDLNDVAQHTGLSSEEIVRRHARATYRVNCVGFTPGFPYLSGLPAELATPRRATPRKSVPAGSVAIGSAQTGIYPQSSPGGWNVIGRTRLRLFDVAKNPPALLRAGDVVHFREITRIEFDALVGRRSAEPARQSLAPPKGFAD